MPAAAWAHELATDDAIGVVLHVDPVDDPIAGKPSSFFFDFDDRDNKFSLDHCHCTVTIRQNGITLVSEQLRETNISAASATYTFPATGVYQIVVNGVPQPQNAFQPFTVSYDIHVNRQVTANLTARSGWVIAVVVGLGSLILVFVIGLALYRKSA